MAIKRIKVSNFRSFQELDLELSPFSVLIGANASGKSNFIQVLRFLRDLVTHGLDDAVSLQGGATYLRNIAIGASQPLAIEVVFDAPGREVFSLTGRDWRLGVAWQEATYRLVLSFGRKKTTFRIEEERLRLPSEFFRLELHRARARIEERQKLFEGSVEYAVVNGNVKAAVEFPQGESLRPEDVVVELAVPPWVLRTTPTRMARLPHLLGTPHPFTEIAIYDFDPKLPKKAVSMAGKAELEEDGSNLALALRTVTQSTTRRRQFTNLVRDLLPFVKNVRLEEVGDKSMLFKLREAFFSGEYLPASMVSDGTINIAALILALYFQKKPLVVIEEPERNVHPHLLAGLVAMMKEASQKRQVIVTTHNPGIVKHADLSSILFVSRDSEGFSRISRPAESADVQTFLRNEIGIDELFTQGVLESLA